MKRMATIVVLALGVAVVAPSSAQALNRTRYWNSSSNPLIVREAGIEQGRGYGTFKVTTTSSGTRALGSGTIRDAKPSGDSVYYQMNQQSNAGLCFAPEYTSCDAPWKDHNSGQSSRTNSGAWATLPVSLAVNSGGDYARGAFKVCEDQRFSPDPCAGPTYTYGDNY